MLITKKQKTLIISLILVFTFAITTENVIAHNAPPCNDSNGDGSPSGLEYAEHHISALAKLGIIGQGHIPGAHQGFSVCDPGNNP